MFASPTDPRIQRSLRRLLLASGLLFVATILIGILNVVATQPLPRAQILTHFHAGTIGWVTLSVIAVTLWMFTSGRTTSSGVVTFVALLSGLGAIVVTGYIAAFAFAFAGGPAWMLPAFGIPSGLAIIAAFAFTLHQRREVVWTAPHLLLSSALLVASLGAIMGILNGLVHVGLDVFPAGGDRIGAHAGPMDMYIALALTGIIEALVGVGTLGRAAKAQAALGVLSGFVASIALLLGIGPLVPFALLLFLASFVVYVIRVGRHAYRGGFGDGIRSATTLGAVFLPVYFVLFVFLVGAYYSQGEFPPKALAVAFAHITFVGMASNLLLAAHASISPSRPGLRWAVWVLNIGLVLFVAEAAMGGRYSAILMAIGTLWAMGHVLAGHWVRR